jgi:hypothetical protein
MTSTTHQERNTMHEDTNTDQGTLRERLGRGADMRAGSLELARRRRAALREELHGLNAAIHRATEWDRWGVRDRPREEARG